MSKQEYLNIKEHQNFIYMIMQKFYCRDAEDLFQVGVIGLLKAARNYQENKNVKFTTYAYDYIFGEMYNYVNKNKPVKVTKEALKLYRETIKAREYLVHYYNREVSLDELATFMELPTATIENIMNIFVPPANIEEQEYLLPVDETVLQDDLIDLRTSINNLEPTEQAIINYRYFSDYTQAETAKILGLSQVTVSRQEQKSLQKIKKML